MFWILVGRSVTNFLIPVSNGIIGSITSSFLFWFAVFLGIIMSIAIHEFSHALAAHLLGDPTPKLEGRLTLNPFKHFETFGFALILFTVFGHGKPVLSNPNNFKNPVQGTLLVALAGPMSNILQACIYGILFIVLNQIPPTQSVLTTITYSLGMLGIFNLNLAFFNLLPIPPLDGEKVWGYAHYRINLFIDTYIAPYAPFIIIILIVPLFGNFSILELLLLPLDNLYGNIIGF